MKLSITENSNAKTIIATGTGKLPAFSETGTPFGNIPIAGTIKRDIQLYGQKIQNLVFASATPKNEPIPAFITTVANAPTFFDSHKQTGISLIDATLIQKMPAVA